MRTWFSASPDNWECPWQDEGWCVVCGENDDLCQCDDSEWRDWDEPVTPLSVHAPKSGSEG